MIDAIVLWMYVPIVYNGVFQCWDLNQNIVGYNL